MYDETEMPRTNETTHGVIILHIPLVSNLYPLFAKILTYLVTSYRYEFLMHNFGQIGGNKGRLRF